MTYATMFLMYVFGYVTCKTFYYLQSSRLSVTLLQTANIFSLFLLTRALEYYETSKALCLKDLHERGVSDNNIKIYENNLDVEIKNFKTKSIDQLVSSHPTFFREVIDYEDWESGMIYLEQNRDLIINAYSK